MSGLVQRRPEVVFRALYVGFVEEIMTLGQDFLLIRRCSLSVVPSMRSIIYDAYHPGDG